MIRYETMCGECRTTVISDQKPKFKTEKAIAVNRKGDTRLISQRVMICPVCGAKESFDGFKGIDGKYLDIDEKVVEVK